jgi:hypothetical protein
MKKTNYKPLYFLLVFVLLLGVFFWIISRPSRYDEFTNELKTSNDYASIKLLFNTYKSEIINEEVFSNEFNSKLESLNLTDDETQEVWSWIPEKDSFLNLVVVPDMSRRLNTPGQPENDKVLLKLIYDEFASHIIEKAKSSNNYISNERLIFEVSDRDAAKGQFGKMADDLILDLKSKKRPYWKYFNDNNKEFYIKSNAFIDLGVAKPNGADYYKYFKDYLKTNTKKSTFNNRFRNVLIIITDGYLETEEINYTGLPEIPSTDQDYGQWEVLILEVDERKNGDYASLKKKWQYWLESMNIEVDEELFFQPKMDATSKTKEIINKFLNKKKGVISQNNISNNTCDGKYSSLIQRATNLLSASKTFNEMNSAKNILKNALIIKNECASINQTSLKGKELLKSSIVNQKISTEEALVSFPNDEDFKKRLALYDDLLALLP